MAEVFQGAAAPAWRAWRRPALGWAAIALLGSAAVLLAVATVVRGMTPETGALSLALQVAACFLGLAFLLGAFQRSDRRARLGWALLLAGMVAMVASTLMWIPHGAHGHGHGGDAPMLRYLHIGSAALTAGGFVTVLGTGMGGTMFARRLLDAGIILASLGLLLGDVLLLPAAQAGGETAWGLVPVAASILMVAFALANYPRMGRDARLAFAPLVVGSILVFASDVTMLYMETHGGMHDSMPLNVGWVLGTLAIAATARLWDPGHLAGEAASRTTWSAEFYPSLLGSMAVLAVTLHMLRTGHAGRPEVLGMGAIFLLATLRHSLRVAEWMAAQRMVEKATAERLVAAQREHELDAERRQNALKTQLLNTASHELNTPLAALKIQLFLHRRALAHRATPDDLHSLDLLDRNVGRLAGLIKDTLDVSRLQSGNLRLQPVPMALRDVVADVLEQFGPLAQGAGVRLRTEETGDVPCHGDPARLTQVVYNLVGNAVKYSPQGSEVKVSIHATGGRVSCSVQDSGVGMTQEQIGRLFQPFSQVQEPSRQLSGAGLGLYISKAIVERHGGSLRCDSPGPGRGVTFTFEVPAVDNRPVGMESAAPVPPGLRPAAA